MEHRKIILASGSPRRKELLTKAGFSFEVFITDVNECLSITDPVEFVSVISKRKAESAVLKYNGADKQKEIIIIAADTVVCIGGMILGKPVDKTDAFNMLKLLDGKRNDVYTGLTVAFKNNGIINYIQDICRTGVYFRKLTDEEIIEYIEKYEPFDKAGSYAIQDKDARLIEKIEGDINNVIGLPVKNLLKIFDAII